MEMKNAALLIVTGSVRAPANTGANSVSLLICNMTEQHSATTDPVCLSIGLSCTASVR